MLNQAVLLDTDPIDADLSQADLSNADLMGADLRGANLLGALILPKHQLSSPGPLANTRGESQAFDR